MNQLKENKAMQDDLIHCTSLIALGLPLFSGYASSTQWKVLTAGGLLFLVVYLVLSLWQIQRNRHMSPEEKREAERESSDERSQMIQNMARQYYWNMENVLIFIVVIVFVFRGQLTVYRIAYLILAVRMFATTAIRWWLERKY